MINALEKLVIEESLQLEKIEAFLEQPNYFEILGVSSKELQHSNFLAWIFDPKGSHNAEDFCLKSFINKLPLEPELKIKLNLANLENTQILREYQCIDLLIVNEDAGFTICIENKIYAPKSGENQLLKYYEIVENTWSKEEHQNIYVYLTPTPRSLTEEEADINYVNITYGEILQILEDTKTSIDLAESYLPLIQNYIQNLRKNIMADSKEILLAQDIYRKHKKAIDFIVNNKPSFYSLDLIKEIEEYFEKHSSYKKLTSHDKNIIRILPTDVLPIFEIDSHSWEGTGSVFALEIFCEEDRIWLKFCFGKIGEKEESRRRIIQEKKTRFFQEMKKFKSIEKYIVSRSRPESYYPSVANINIVKIDDPIVQKIDDKYEVFKERFEEIDKEVLKNWVKEVKAMNDKLNNE